MKKILCILLLLLLLVQPVWAAENPRLVDDGGLLSLKEEEALLERLDEISEAYRIDVVVVTVDGLGGKSAMAYADDYFDYNGYGMGADRSGILLLISMEERDYWFSTRGDGEEIFTYSGLGYIEEQILPDLSDGEYYDAFREFAELCEEFLDYGGNPYDGEEAPQEFSLLKSLLISLAVGLVIAFVVTGIMKSQLKTVRRKSGATDYMTPGSLNLTNATDLFLYSHVSRVAKPKEESSGGSHRSSSGASHGGRGGKF